MPQLDFTIIFPQIFYLCICFTIFYFILVYFLLPKFLISLKIRKFILEKNLKQNETLNIFGNVKNSELINDKLLKNLETLSDNFTNLDFALKNLKIETMRIDLQISQSILNSFLYCDLSILNNILFFPKNLNLKFQER